MHDSEDRLTAKQQRFVKSYAQGTSATQAVLDAGYEPTSRKSAHAMATALTAKPKIQAALQKALAEVFPNAERDSLQVLRDIICDERMAPSARMKAIETLARIFGWNAPTKHASLNVESKLTLPEE